jgi:hypothetical protein
MRIVVELSNSNGVDSMPSRGGSKCQINSRYPSEAEILEALN